jgi:hypothetical protein
MKRRTARAIAARAIAIDHDVTSQAWLRGASFDEQVLINEMATGINKF